MCEVTLYKNLMVEFIAAKAYQLIQQMHHNLEKGEGHVDFCVENVECFQSRAKAFIHTELTQLHFALDSRISQIGSYLFSSITGK